MTDSAPAPGAHWVTCADYVQAGCTRYPDGSTFIPEVHAGHEGVSVTVCQATVPELWGQR